MATPDERQILRIIEEEGGETHEVVISKGMGLRPDYIKSILKSMGTRDYVNVFLSGKVEIADKGWRILGKSSPTSSATDSIANETPEERFKRYMSREEEEEEESSGKPEQKSPETAEETSETLENKTLKEPAESCKKTIEELAAEPSSPEEKFQRYMSR